MPREPQVLAFEFSGQIIDIAAVRAGVGAGEEKQRGTGGTTSWPFYASVPTTYLPEGEERSFGEFRVKLGSISKRIVDVTSTSGNKVSLSEKEIRNIQQQLETMIQRAWADTLNQES